MSIQEVREKLKVYRALDNEIRLRILLTLSKESPLAFSDIVRRVGVEKGLLAYHIGVLKSVGLVECRYERHSSKLSKYWLTDKARKVLKELNLI
ncbi:MAG: hypothetical protein DRJ43_04660 [Thermoprotei archaeon]|nr:MAG: hypothetical protein DRJ43_04660 [Thermoprotei archaeon]